jgi:Fur family ferric uptake transcriptional regulator
MYAVHIYVTKYNMDSKTLETVNRIFTEYLKENKCRRTPERYAILNAIYSFNGNFEINDLLKVLEEKDKFRVSRATVYNTITLLINANLVIHHQFGTESKYERCYGNEKAHMVCTNCGKVTEINNININDYITANIKKFHLTHYSLYIYGVCNKCHQAIKRRKARMNKKIGQ